MVWFKRTRKIVRKATNFDGIYHQQSFLINLFRYLFKCKHVQNEIDFGNLNDLGIDNNKVNRALNLFTWYYRLFGALFIILLVYTLYLILKSHLMSAILSGALSLVFLAKFFKFHFWTFQIHSKKLGCSFNEWINYLLKRSTI